MWTSFIVGRGQTLKIGAVHGGSQGGSRAYLAFAGGLDIPDYLGSKSTFPGGSLGGHQGRALRMGDMLFLLPAGGHAAETGPLIHLALGMSWAWICRSVHQVEGHHHEWLQLCGSQLACYWGFMQWTAASKQAEVAV